MFKYIKDTTLHRWFLTMNTTRCGKEWNGVPMVCFPIWHWYLFLLCQDFCTYVHNTKIAWVRTYYVVTGWNQKTGSSRQWRTTCSLATVLCDWSLVEHHSEHKQFPGTPAPTMWETWNRRHVFLQIRAPARKDQSIRFSRSSAVWRGESGAQELSQAQSRDICQHKIL